MNSASGTKYVIGVDYGTLSGRALLVRVSDGAEIASAVHAYSHEVMEDVLPTTGEKLPPDWALQMLGRERRCPPPPRRAWPPRAARR